MKSETCTNNPYGPFTNHVCTSAPFCLCVGGRTVWNECDCQYGGFARCQTCNALMVKIDASTGEPVLEYCRSAEPLDLLSWADGS